MPEKERPDLLDPSTPAGELACLLDDADELSYRTRRDTARRMAVQLRAVRLVETHPETVLDLVHEANRDDRHWAVRAVIADLATRANLTEITVMNEVRQATTLQRTPNFWREFLTGTIAPPNATALAEIVDTVPLDAGLDAALDQAAVEAAQFAPPRFRARLRRLRERLHPESLEQRSRAALERRCTSFQPMEDGMAWYGVLGPAHRLAEAHARVDAAARHLADQPGETRTLDQLRADVATDLLTGVGETAGGAQVQVQVGVMVPVMTLLGRSEEPAVLEGYGPIDLEAAKELVGRAKSFLRVLVHPVNGTVLDVDRRSYAPPADLKRWVRMRDQLCTFSGCGRPARLCDIDHTTAWAVGGTTSADNLAPVCPPHHQLKHRTRWEVERPPGAARLRWRSPTGAVRNSDPPPF